MRARTPALLTLTASLAGCGVTGRCLLDMPKTDEQYERCVAEGKTRRVDERPPPREADEGALRVAYEEAARGCQRREPRACLEAAAYERKRDYPPATIDARLQIACDARLADGCFMRGQLAESVDHMRAIAAYEEACALGSREGCAAAGRLDPIRLAYFDARACDLAVYPSCTRAGIAYVEGRGVTPDRERGVRLLRHACAYLQLDACSRLDALGIPRTAPEM